MIGRWLLRCLDKISQTTAMKLQILSVRKVGDCRQMKVISLTIIYYLLITTYLTTLKVQLNFSFHLCPLFVPDATTLAADALTIRETMAFCGLLLYAIATVRTPLNLVLVVLSMMIYFEALTTLCVVWHARRLGNR